MKLHNLLPLLLLLILGCKTPETVTEIQLSEMPLTAGDSWSYAVTNYPATQTDTAVFTIGAQTGSLSSVTYTTQTTIHGAVVDSGSERTIANTRIYTGNNGQQSFAGSGLFDGWQLNFPILPQSSWTVSGQTVNVIASGQNLTIGGNNYRNVYTLARTSTTPGGPVTDTMLIAPNVGIVQWHGFPLVSCSLH